MTWVDELGADLIAVDTPVFIYFVEQHPRFAAIVRPLIEAANSGVVRLVASELVLLEVLVAPMRAGDHSLARRYEDILSRADGLDLRRIDASVLRTAAGLRASTSLRTPDAIHVATAIAAGATAFVTGDRRIPPIDGLTVRVVGDIVG